jgi:multidrug resistance efflux pump
MKKLSLVLMILILASVILTACSSSTPEPVVVETSARSGTIIAEGRLVPLHSMDQSFSIPGQVAEVLVQDGEVVQSGQVLARLESSPEAQVALARAQQEVLAAQQALDGLQSAAQVSLTQARLDVITAQEQVDAAQDQYDADASDENKARLDAAEAVLEQAGLTLEKLEDGDGIDPDQLAAAEARKAAADAALVSAQSAVDAQDLIATIDGTVVDLALQVGQRVAAGLPVLTLADYSGWLVETDNLTENEVANVQMGQKVEIILDALPDLSLTGEVSHINARSEEKRGDVTYTTSVVLSQGDPALRWGMTAALRFLP